MNCLIVDNQMICRNIMKKLIDLDVSLVLIGECSDAVDALKIIQDHHVDIIFLDIEMPGISGIELVRILDDKRPMIIFTTSKTEYAAEAFDLNVLDFLVKPVTPARFIKSVEKAKELIKIRDVILHKEDGFVFIRDSNIVKRIKINDILYMEANKDYVKIYLSNQTYSIHSSLKSVEEKLSQNIFLRIHRSFIINISKVDTIKGGTLIINNNMIPVSDAYRSMLNKRMRIL
ncbi:transcriptional regulator [Pedobacter lusitanus]|uniref:Transcriptional regulator n=1 Tax=Pedobacter lusitanus TaxID=1503925 RepID=A0A0D0G099_9SPHI|nr:LytTR family DNA-binding domain-containing protein [Pedobacter lusitanus]KIO78219.1 transcriptional regulator [Pedobacter lusitanus]